MFKDLDDFFEDYLDLPIGGKVYSVPPVDAETGLRLQNMLGIATAAHSGARVTTADLERLNLDDNEERDLYQTCLGTAWDEMVADKVSWPRVRLAGITAFMWFATGDRDLAASIWNTGEGSVRGKARKRPQDRKPKKAGQTTR